MPLPCDSLWYWKSGVVQVASGSVSKGCPSHLSAAFRSVSSQGKDSDQETRCQVRYPGVMPGVDHIWFRSRRTAGTYGGLVAVPRSSDCSTDSRAAICSATLSESLSPTSRRRRRPQLGRPGRHLQSCVAGGTFDTPIAVDPGGMVKGTPTKTTCDEAE